MLCSERLCVSGLLAFLMIGSSGCGRPTVSGQVAVDGKAVDVGTISFIPADSKAGSGAWTEVKAGRYSISNGLALGSYRVEIRSTHKTGRMLPALPPSPAHEEVVESVSARYNSNSELTAKINPGKNTLDFALKSQ